MSRPRNPTKKRALNPLLSSEVMIKSFKQVRFAFNNEIFSIPFFAHLGKEIQYRAFTPLSRISEQPNAHDVIKNTTTIIYNLHKVFSFLSALLPDDKETRNFLRTIVLPLQQDLQLSETANGHDDHDDLDHLDVGQSADYVDHNSDDKTLIYTKPSVSFKLGAQPSPEKSKRDYNADQVDDNDDNADDNADQVDDNDDTADDNLLRPQFHSRAPLFDDRFFDSETSPTKQTRHDQTLTLTRPKQFEPPPNRQRKYNLRTNPKPSQKYQ